MQFHCLSRKKASLLCLIATYQELLQFNIIFAIYRLVVIMAASCLQLWVLRFFSWAFEHVVFVITNDCDTGAVPNYLVAWDIAVTCHIADKLFI